MFKKNRLMSKIMRVVSGGEKKEDSVSEAINSINTLNNGTVNDNNSQTASDKADQFENPNIQEENLKKIEKISAQFRKEDLTLIESGAQAYNKKDYEQAISLYTKSIEINPSNGSVYNNIGNVYLRGKKDPQAALPFYIQATTIEPSFNYGWLNLALCQKELGDISGALETVAKGLKALDSKDGLHDVLIQLQSQLNIPEQPHKL